MAGTFFFLQHPTVTSNGNKRKQQWKCALITMNSALQCSKCYIVPRYPTHILSDPFKFIFWRKAVDWKVKKNTFLRIKPFPLKLPQKFPLTSFFCLISKMAQWPAFSYMCSVIQCGRTVLALQVYNTVYIYALSKRSRANKASRSRWSKQTGIGRVERNEEKCERKEKEEM